MNALAREYFDDLFLRALVPRTLYRTSVASIKDIESGIRPNTVATALSLCEDIVREVSQLRIMLGIYFEFSHHPRVQSVDCPKLR